MPIYRQLDGDKVDVTFEIELHGSDGPVCVAGDWNDWQPQPMEDDGQDAHRVTVRLKPGHSYRFRYLLGDGTWTNDFTADDFVANPYGGYDAVINL